VLGVVRCWGGQVLGWVELRRVAGRGARGCRAGRTGLQGSVARVAGRCGRLDELGGRLGDGREPRALDRRLGHEHDVAAVLHPLVRLAGPGRGQGGLGLG
jgi:hypothetical protein